MVTPLTHPIVQLLLLFVALAPATYSQVVQTLPFVPVAIDNSGAILGYNKFDVGVQWVPIVIQKDGSITPLAPPGTSARPFGWNELSQAVGLGGGAVLFSGGGEFDGARHG